MAINSTAIDFDHGDLEQHYLLLRAWVQHNEAHRRQLGPEAGLIQIPLADFAAQWERVRREPSACTAWSRE